MCLRLRAAAEIGKAQSSLFHFVADLDNKYSILAHHDAVDVLSTCRVLRAHLPHVFVVNLLHGFIPQLVARQIYNKSKQVESGLKAWLTFHPTQRTQRTQRMQQTKEKAATNTAD